METIIAVKEYQQEVILRLEFMIAEKMHSLSNQQVDYHDIIELDIIQTLIQHFSSTFEITTDDIPFEILSPWMTIKVYKDLLQLYQKQTKLNDDEYIVILDKVATKLFVGLFSSH